MLTKRSEIGLCGVVKGMARVCNSKAKVIEILPVKEYSTQKQIASSKASLIVLLEQL